MNTQRIRFGALLRKPVGELLSERRANVFYSAITLVTLLISACVGGGEEPMRSAFRTVGAAHASADASAIDAPAAKGPEGRSAEVESRPEQFSSPYQPSAEEYRAMAVAEYVEPF
jgi:hypothetical protein